MLFILQVILNCQITGRLCFDQEIFDTVEFIKNNSGEAEYDESIDAKLTTDQKQ